ncbi:sulfatase-like hydrolase/transferase [Haloarcula salina]|uniref:Sulfatase-like hydrolase/transferase n=1 Tax=Haloarcula salina TaxID=1429914 RepID=A0AA41KLW1_9EURY|nr:sulfatase-like hydrolase/transferase [Haloarcula salina]MBV0903309.1 sulfatase-like hydrolase/transferase [Haloarcula salina]
MGKHNVLLVVLDSVRAQNTSLHGYHRETTPEIDSFAEEATKYTQARAPGSWTLASHSSMFTGLHVDEHLMTHNDHAIESGNSVWNRLSKQGYQTGIFSENPFLTRGSTGLDSGFDTVDATDKKRLPYPGAVDPFDYVHDYDAFAIESIRRACPLRSFLNGIVAMYEPDALDGLGAREAGKTPAQRTIDSFLDWHQSVSSGPWGACLNVMDAHWPYEPRERIWADRETERLQSELDSDSFWKFEGGQRPWSDWKAMEDLYDDCIRQADAAIGSLLEELDRRNAITDTIIIITSDHGEAFGEQSVLRDTRVREHGNGIIHETVTHVPLVIRWPNSRTSRDVPSPVSLTWLGDILDTAAIEDCVEEPLARHQNSVLCSTHGLEESESKYKSGTEYVNDMRPFAGQSRAVYENHPAGVRKYVEFRGPKDNRNTATVHISDDGERTVEAETDDGRVREIFAGIDDASVRQSSRAHIDDDLEEQLADLGYV